MSAILLLCSHALSLEGETGPEDYDLGDCDLIKLGFSVLGELLDLLTFEGYACGSLFGLLQVTVEKLLCLWTKYLDIQFCKAHGSRNLHALSAILTVCARNVLQVAGSDSFFRW
jgi:hypothetical protein